MFSGVLEAQHVRRPSWLRHRKLCLSEEAGLPELQDVSLCGIQSSSRGETSQERRRRTKHWAMTVYRSQRFYVFFYFSTWRSTPGDCTMRANIFFWSKQQCFFFSSTAEILQSSVLCMKSNSPLTNSLQSLSHLNRHQWGLCFFLLNVLCLKDWKVVAVCTVW